MSNERVGRTMAYQNQSRNEGNSKAVSHHQFYEVSKSKVKNQRGILNIFDADRGFWAMILKTCHKSVTIMSDRTKRKIERSVGNRVSPIINGNEQYVHISDILFLR